MIKKYKITSQNHLQEDRDFWKNKGTDERLSAVEFLREQFYVINGFKEIPRIKKEISTRIKK